MSDAAPRRIALSLVAHTNVGKTTLARTLLGRDIGSVRDAPHVTLEAERHALIDTPDGDRLDLWDTPGFGDSARLARRLAQRGNPVGWFLDQVWDRLRDPALWSSQQALRNVLAEADVVLYLASAAEPPEDAGYLDPELRVLALLGKPVVVLLNQLGPPRPPEAEATELQRWRERLAGAACVRAVLPLDAFARCWVQERALLDAVGAALPAEHQPAFARLRAAWLQRGHAVWQASMAELARRLARAALERQPVDEDGWAARLHDIGTGLGLKAADADTPRRRAMARLAERLEAQTRDSTDTLLRLHGLEGTAATEVLARLAEHYAAREPLSEGKAALWGGALAGGLAGLKADLASGGLTLGGGLLAGSVLGALGAAGLARGVNRVRGLDRPTLAWSAEMLDGLTRSALLGYLAVAHFGRGRGAWAASETPPAWPGVVDAIVAERQPALHALWARRENLREQPAEQAEDALASRLAPWLEEAGGALLARLYPLDAAAAPAGATSARSH